MNEKTTLLHKAIQENANQPQYEGYYCIGCKKGKRDLCFVFDVDIYARTANGFDLRNGCFTDTLYYVKKESVPAHSPEILQVFIDVLEELRSQDPDAINQLFAPLAACNEKIANNSLVPLVYHQEVKCISALSVINAICKKLTGKWVGANVKIQKFEIESFNKYESKL